MKKFKSGFTMAELLLCIGIIGVVTALGMTITKQTTQKAYNTYYKTGYANLYDVLFDIRKEDNAFNRASGSDNSDFTHINNINPDIRNSNWMMWQLAERFQDGVNKDIYDIAQLAPTVTTKNGIQYNVLFAGTHTNNDRNVDTLYYLIQMTVPQPKTRQNQNGSVSTILYYVYGRDDGLLIPTDLMVNNTGNIQPIPPGINPQAGWISLQTRRDLLPFYLDDHQRGRVTRNNSGNPVYKRIDNVYDYQNAYCTVSNSLQVGIPNSINIVNNIVNNGDGDNAGDNGNGNSNNAEDIYGLAADVNWNGVNNSSIRTLLIVQE